LFEINFVQLKYQDNLKIDSAILQTPQEARSLTSLIGFESRSFSLLWRGSRDGFGVSTFHSRCDGKPNTLTLIKNTHGYVFGGYTAVPWSSSSTYHSDTTAFLFSLKNLSNNPLKLKVIEPENAVAHNLLCGPIFGRNDMEKGRDLSFYNFEHPGNCMNFKSYEFPNGKQGEEGGKYVVGGSSKYYNTVEIEVFQIF